MDSPVSVNHCHPAHDSEPSSPNSFNLGLKYYSLPTGGLKTAPLTSDHEDEPDDEGFEFETNLHSSYCRGQQNQQLGRGRDVAPMAFADELFCNGQVMPLKPPPRLHYANNSKCSNQSSCASSPTSSPSSIMKGPFCRWSFGKNDNVDFDPFMIALEVVRNEVGDKELNRTHRRSRSLSPPRLWPTSNRSTGEFHDQNKEIRPQQPAQVGSTLVKQTETKHPAMMKSTSYRRSTSNRRIKPTMTTLPGPTGKKSDPCSKNAIERDGSRRKGSKRHNIKDGSIKNDSENETNCDENLLLQTETSKRPQNMRNLSFKAIQKNHYNEQKQLLARKRTSVPYRTPCMLVCLGFGHSGLRDLN